ncbi:MAG TPA: hypothetical protein DCF63_19720 [Planctomycetaceae bacterium]|nr:hypothetical protein [Planctomycetaceae bacterium]
MCISISRLSVSGNKGPYQFSSCGSNLQEQDYDGSCPFAQWGQLLQVTARNLTGLAVTKVKMWGQASSLSMALQASNLLMAFG